MPTPSSSPEVTTFWAPDDEPLGAGSEFSRYLSAWDRELDSYYALHNVTARTQQSTMSTMSSLADRDLDPLWQDLDW
jgi:hypothetical protein